MCRSPNAVRQTLRELPKTLFDTYDRMLQNVPATYQRQVRKALVWLAYHNSVEPLTLAALAEAVIIDTPNRTFSTEDRFFDPNDLLDMCSSLITIPDQLYGSPELAASLNDLSLKMPAKENRLVQLTHSSVNEYVQSRTKGSWDVVLDFDGGGVQKYMTETCLIYLMTFNKIDSLRHDYRMAPQFLPEWVAEFNPPKTKLVADLGLLPPRNDDCEKYPLLVHASLAWYRYYETIPAELNQETSDLMISFFDKEKSCAYANWMGVHSRRPIGEPAEQPIIFASQNRMLQAITVLLGHGADVNTDRGRFGSPLAAACWQKRTTMDAANLADPATIVKLLLAHGAQVDLPKREYDVERRVQGDALLGAICCCLVDVAKILIEAGAVVNSDHLYAATWKGIPSIINMLVDRGVELDTSALQDAILSRKDMRVQNLLDIVLHSVGEHESQHTMSQENWQQFLYERVFRFDSPL